VTVKLNAAGEIGAGVVLKVAGRTAWVATAAHVVGERGEDHVFRERPSIAVTFPGNAIRTFPALVRYPKPRVTSNSTIDIAVIEVTSPTQEFPNQIAQRGRVDDLTREEHVSFTGHPRDDLAWECRKDAGTITRLSYMEEDRKFVFATSQVEKGDSGGPVFDHLGRLIGLVLEKQPRQASAIAIRIGPVLRMMEDELAISLGNGGPCSGPSGCSVPLSQLKLVTQYTDEPSGPGQIKREEKVYQFPEGWPIGPYLHVLSASYDLAAAYKGVTTDKMGRPLSQQQIQQMQQQAPTRLPAQLGIAATTRKGDSDVKAMFGMSTKITLIRGSDGHSYEIKFYNSDDLNSMTIEVKLADGASLLDLAK
jgi:hypothetical protein